MTVWEERPIEVANLFNPAFCGETIRLCVKSYVNEAGSGLPYLLSFLVLPVVMYGDTRVTMVARRYAFLYNWLQDHPHLRIEFAERVRELLPFSRESLMFLLQINALTLDDDGTLKPTQYRRKGVRSQNEDSIKDCYDKAELLGKWFARAGDVTTIYAMWGVQL
jgi:hypothetical protein